MVVDTAMTLMGMELGMELGMGMGIPVVVARLKLDPGNLPRSTDRRMAMVECHHMLDTEEELHHMVGTEEDMDIGTKPKVFVDGKWGELSMPPPLPFRCFSMI